MLNLTLTYIPIDHLSIYLSMYNVEKKLSFSQIKWSLSLRGVEFTFEFYIIPLYKDDLKKMENKCHLI